ncbi:MAG TPA: SDR family NAD(P)-dependent oxidoreductase [Steroidobacteraceae bacterium]|jgi:NAD(P)-dependent dehydrogenase (short-subunit alcohol dehydrogenase family)
MALLDGKVAVITGAGTGLGQSYARLLARQGAAVVVNDFAPAPANSVVEEIRGRGGRAVAAVADVGCMSSGESILQAALDAFGRVDILVNNAGILRDKSLLKMEEEDWDAVVRVHLKGTFCVTKPIFGHMKERGTGGVIVNTTSTAGLRGKFGQTNYGSAKAGIWGFSNSLAQEGLKYGIRVWTIAPAAASQLTDGVVSEEYKKIFTADRVAPVLLYMVSDLSGKQTGKTLLAGGGYVSEIRMQIGPGFVPGDAFEVGDLVAAIDAGQVLLPERDLAYVNAYGPTTKKA